MSDINQQIHDHIQSALNLIREKNHDTPAVAVRWALAVEMLSEDAPETEILTEYPDTASPWAIHSFSWLMGKDAEDLLIGNHD